MKKDWNEITINDQQRIKDISELQTVGDDEKNMMVAAYLSGMDYEDFLQLPLDRAKDLMDGAEFLLQKPKPNKAKRKYEINGHAYTLFRDPAEMTVAQYISFQQIQADGFANRPLEMLALFIVPEGHQYNDGYSMEDVMEDMGNMGILDALGVCDFFMKRCLRSIKRIKELSNLMLKVQRLKAPEEAKEMIRATEIQMRTIVEELERLYGSLR